MTSVNILRTTTTLILIIVASICIREIAVGTNHAHQYLLNSGAHFILNDDEHNHKRITSNSTTTVSNIKPSGVLELLNQTILTSLTNNEKSSFGSEPIKNSTQGAVKSNTPEISNTTLALQSSRIQSNETISGQLLLEGTEDARQRRFQIAIKPFANVSTLGFADRRFYSGYRNQIMAFTYFVMQAVHLKHDQILLQTLLHKDTYGSDRLMPHEFLFDVEHWNSYYPQLPRMVSCDPGLFAEFDCNRNNWKRNVTPMYLHPYGKHHHLFGGYKRYSSRKGPFANQPFPHRADLLIMQGALRPHPDLQDIINQQFQSLTNSTATTHATMQPTTNTITSASSSSSNSSMEYMTLHARVEPDMQKHPVCSDKKVVNLTQIFKMVQSDFPNPPANRLFLPINRQYMEKEGYPNQRNPNATNWLAVENLQVLNDAIRHGLWGGKVQVFEFGSNILRGTKYEHRPSTIGALLNFHLALHSKIFIGTEISTYSTDLVHARFYQGNKQNYKYLPSGIERWTTEHMSHPPGFWC